MIKRSIVVLIFFMPNFYYLKIPSFQVDLQAFMFMIYITKTKSVLIQ